jgi:pilus assembly protein CpaB
MNKLRAILTLLAALLLASATVFIVVRYVAPRTHSDTHKIVVAERDVELGAPLAPDDLKLVEWPRESTPAGSFTEFSGLLRDSSTQTPRIARSTILKGEPVLESHLALLGSQGGLSAVIRPGNRAITVRVNDVVGVAGFALPGSYVDVLVNTTVPGAQVGGSEGSISKIVLEHILVLAAAQEVAREDAKPKVVNAVTLEVTPRPG